MIEDVKFNHKMTEDIMYDKFMSFVKKNEVVLKTINLNDPYNFLENQEFKRNFLMSLSKHMFFKQSSYGNYSVFDFSCLNWWQHKLSYFRMAINDFSAIPDKQRIAENLKSIMMRFPSAGIKTLIAFGSAMALRFAFKKQDQDKFPS